MMYETWKNNGRPFRGSFNERVVLVMEQEF